MSHLNFSILAFYTNFFPDKSDISGNWFDRKNKVFKNSLNMTIFGIFSQLLSTQNVNVARFARMLKETFSVIVKHHEVVQTKVESMHHGCTKASYIFIAFIHSLIV